MTAALGASQSGLRFRAFGFPVRVEWSFFLIALFLYGTRDMQFFFVWIAVLLPSILVHELGHAFAARGLGAKPSIVIHSFGGYTAYMPPREPTRRESIGVSLAGPFAGFGLGLVVVGVAFVAGFAIDLDIYATDDVARRTIGLAILINLGWGLLNLLPMLPLDGGHVVEQLLPGDVLTRHRRAAMISVVVALAASALVWFRFQQPFIALFVLYFGVQSVMTLSRTKAGSGDDVRSRGSDALERLRSGELGAVCEIETLATETSDTGLQRQLKTLAVEVHAGSGNPGEARRVLNQVPGDVHPSLYALVGAFEGDPTALASLYEIFNRSADLAATRNLVLAYGQLGRAHEIAPVVAQSAHAANDEILHIASETAKSQGHAAAAQHLQALRLANGGLPPQ